MGRGGKACWKWEGMKGVSACFRSRDCHGSGDGPPSRLGVGTAHPSGHEHPGTHHPARPADIHVTGNPVGEGGARRCPLPEHRDCDDGKLSIQPGFRSGNRKSPLVLANLENWVARQRWMFLSGRSGCHPFPLAQMSLDERFKIRHRGSGQKCPDSVQDRGVQE